MRDLLEISNAAKSLTKNPLSVIGLFIVLIYGFACLVLGKSSDNFNTLGNTILIGFIVIFPNIILWVFYKLVTEHHQKLYAPGDYKDESNFFRRQTDEERSQKLDQEVTNIVASRGDVSGSNTDTSSLPSIEEVSEVPPSVIPENDTLDIPRFQRTVTAETIYKKTRSDYANAERLAFLALENELQSPFQKYVRHDFFGTPETADGLLIESRHFKIFEIKYVATYNLQVIAQIDKLVNKYAEYKKSNAGVKFELWIAFVLDLHEKDSKMFELNLLQKARNYPLQVRFRFYNYSELLEKYG